MVDREEKEEEVGVERDLPRRLQLGGARGIFSWRLCPVADAGAACRKTLASRSAVHSAELASRLGQLGGRQGFSAVNGNRLHKAGEFTSQATTSSSIPTTCSSTACPRVGAVLVARSAGNQSEVATIAAERGRNVIKDSGGILPTDSSG